MKRKWFWFVLLILSFTFGVAFTAFATPKAGTVIEKGKIITKEIITYKDPFDGQSVDNWLLRVAYKDRVYRCTIDDKVFYVDCTSYPDKGTLHAD